MRPADEEEIARLVALIRRHTQSLNEATLVAALKASPLLRPAEVGGTPVELIAARRSARVVKNRVAARAPRRSQVPRILEECARLERTGAAGHEIAGRVAGIVGVTPTYVRQVRKKRNRAFAEFRAAGAQ